MQSMGVNGEALQLHEVSKKVYFVPENPYYQYCKSCENPYQVLQVTCVRLNVQWNRSFIWQNHYHHSTKLYQKKHHSVGVGIGCALEQYRWLQLVIFSSIALILVYYCSLYYLDGIVVYCSLLQFTIVYTSLMALSISLYSLALTSWVMARRREMFISLWAA